MFVNSCGKQASSYNIHMGTSLKERILCMDIADKCTKSTKKICHNKVRKLAAYEMSFLHYNIGYNYVGT